MQPPIPELVRHAISEGPVDLLAPEEMAAHNAWLEERAQRQDAFKRAANRLASELQHMRCFGRRKEGEVFSPFPHHELPLIGSFESADLALNSTIPLEFLGVKKTNEGTVGCNGDMVIFRDPTDEGATWKWVTYFEVSICRNDVIALGKRSSRCDNRPEIEAAMRRILSRSPKPKYLDAIKSCMKETDCKREAAWAAKILVQGGPMQGRRKNSGA